MRHQVWGIILATGLLAAAGCGGDTSGGGVLPKGAIPLTRFELANGCYALKSISEVFYVVKGASGYAATAAAASAAEPFYMKPSALNIGLGPSAVGEGYLFYTKDAQFMSAGSGTLTTDAAPGETSDWVILDSKPVAFFNIFSKSAGKFLAVDPATKSLVLSESPGQFSFDAATGCAEFPEPEVGATGETFKGAGVNQPVLGFADVHNHIMATTFLGGAHYGAPFSRFGVTDALGDCAAVHGPNGIEDVLGNFEGYGNPVSTHDTVGWPTFVDWPAPRSLTHEGTYYKWLERAWMAGLRIIINNTVENQVLCTLESVSKGHAPQCNEMDSAESQIKTAHDLQDYIDAQSGGPGKGWLRIVKSPAEARAVINDGKLAMVLGIEISHLFNCTVNNGMDGCTKADIDAKLNELYDLGIREMFPLHEFDNALGGNGIFDGTVLNFGNRADTGAFWSTYDCPDQDYFYGAGAIMNAPLPGVTGGDPLTLALIAASGSGGVLPLYNTTKRQCNARGLTDLGKYAIQQMMKKKIIMEVDHLELSIKTDVIKLGGDMTPKYPVLSAHGGHGGISTQQAKDILANGGLIYPMHDNGKGWFDTFTRLKTVMPTTPGYFVAMGYGADTNGLATQAGARAPGKEVVYPFTLFDKSKPEWSGEQFKRVAPITFVREKSGERVFDINIDGSAHYGLKADWVEEVRIEGGKEGLDALYNSAEAYLRMWEQTVNR